MKKWPLVLAAIVFAVSAEATPVITNVTGTVQTGQTLTITGSGFGAKGVAAPVKYDNFESGTPGNTLSGWTLSVGGHAPGGGLNPIYSSTVVRTNSTRSADARFDNLLDCGDEGCDSGSSFGVTLGGAGYTEAYVDAWVYYDASSPSESRNVKLMRMHSGGAGQPNLYFNIYCFGDTDGARLGQDGGGTNTILPSTPWRGSTFFNDNWRHVQMYLKQSSVNVVDGYGWLQIDNAVSINKPLKTRIDSRFWDTWFFGNFVAHYGLFPCGQSSPACCGVSYPCSQCWKDTFNPTNIYWDNAYVDTTRAHVEFGNATTYAACTHTEVQIPSAWSSSSIAVTANLGSFNPTSTMYAYVVDRDGVVNASGFPLSSAVDPTQSYYVPQAIVNSTVVEGSEAIKYAVTCPNNDILLNNARLKIVLKNAAGTPISGVPAASIYGWLNGGPVSQGFSGGGEDTLMASSIWQPVAGCPDLRFITADASTDPTGTTYLTWKGAGGVRNPNRKWGLFAGSIPIIANGITLQGRLTTGSANGTYTAHVKNVDVTALLTTNGGESVNIGDYNVVAAAVGGAYQYKYDFDNDGDVDVADVNFLRLHLRHQCNYPTGN